MSFDTKSLSSSYTLSSLHLFWKHSYKILWIQNVHFFCTYFDNHTPISPLLLLQLHMFLVKVNCDLHNGKSNGQVLATTMFFIAPGLYTDNYFLLLEAFATLGIKGSFFSNITGHIPYSCFLMTPSHFHSLYSLPR